ncbi:MAG: CarD family transcriptional regulator [Oscillospiraceae bacterium]|nr:CarD family transcriptional regulator [Oscillospiraceae bacterium]
MYLIGDKVVHPMHGAGIIEAITEERLAGKRATYYVFRMPVGGLVLKIPTENCGVIGVRELSSDAQIETVLQAIPELDVEMNANWNHRYRENMARIKSGDLLEVARVIKGLMWRDAQRGLSNGERKMLHTAKQILISEIVLVQGSVYQDAERRVNETMMAGVS